MSTTSRDEGYSYSISNKWRFKSYSYRWHWWYFDAIADANTGYRWYCLYNNHGWSNECPTNYYQWYWDSNTHFVTGSYSSYRNDELFRINFCSKRGSCS